MRVLSVDGGGYLGLASAAFIEETERHFDCSFSDQFDLFCGTSTGAIIALALANGMTGKEIVGLYKELGKKVFWNPVPGYYKLRTAWSFLAAKYSNRKLKASLMSAFGDTTIGDLMSRDKKVLVTAFSLTNGTPRVFKTDHTSRLSTDNGWKLRDVALASAAAPTYFPIARVTSPSGDLERYCDGGVFSNHPALLGYAEAVAELKTKPEDVRVLSLSTPRANLAEQKSLLWVLRQLPSRGILMWASSLPGIFVDGNSIISHHVLQRLMCWENPEAHHYVRVMFEKPRRVEMDFVSSYCTDTLEKLGKRVAREKERREQLLSFGFKQ